MPLFDTADLLARCKREARRPAVDREMEDGDWYAYLTEAQVHWVREIATQVPEQMFVTEKLATADGGVTYTFSLEPMGDYELRISPTGRLLVPGAEWDMAADFVPNGQTIRFPGQKPKAFSNGPWARYVPTPDVIDLTHEPTLKPTHARILLVHRALILWASRGGLRDPRPFQQLENDAWFGNPATGQFGLQAMLRSQPFLGGSAAIPSGTADDWYRYVDDGSGYVPGGG